MLRGTTKKNIPVVCGLASFQLSGFMNTFMNWECGAPQLHKGRSSCAHCLSSVSRTRHSPAAKIQILVLPSGESKRVSGKVMGRVRCQKKHLGNMGSDLVL